MTHRGPHAPCKATGPLPAATQRPPIVIITMLAVLSLFSTSAFTRQQPKPTRPLVVGSEEDYPPFATGQTDGSADGFTVALWKAVAAERELNYTISVRPFREVLQGFKSGSIDVLINLAHSEERQAYADFSVPHVVVHGAIFVRKGEPRIRSEADLSGKSTIVIDSDLAHDYAVSKGWTAQLVLVDNVAEGMKLLATGQHDAMLVGKLAGMQTLKALGIRNVVALASRAGFSQKFCFAVQKGNPELLAALNEGLAVAKSNGAYDAAYEKWFGVFEHGEISVRQLLGYLGPVALGLAILAGLFLVRAHERKKSADRLRESEERLRLALSAASQGLYDLNVQTGECLVSPEYALMLGYDPAEFRESNAAWRERLHPDDREKVYGVYTNYVAGRLDEYRVEFRQRTRDGGWKWVLSLGKIVERTAEGLPLRMLGTHTDITERKVAEGALEDSEDRFRKLIEHAPEAIVLMDATTGRFIQANRAAERLFKLSEAELCKVGPLEMSPSTQPDRRLTSEKGPELIAEAIAGGTPIFEWTHRDSQYHEIPCEIRLLSFTIGDRVVVRGSITDITERKRLEQEREQYLKFFLLSTEPMCIADPFGCFKQVNPAFTRLTGFSESELITKPFLDFILPEDRERTVDEMKLQVSLRPSLHFENRYVCKDGSIVLLSWTAIFDKSDGVTYATARDVTKLRQTEVAWQEALSRLQKIARQVPGMIYQYRMRPDGTGCFPFASEAIREIYRVSPDEVVEDASKVFSVLHAEDYDGVVASMQQSARDLTPWRHEYRVRFDDGTVRWLYGNALPQREADGSTIWHGFITDITERRKAQLERAQLDRKVQETQKLESLGVLAGGIAHDFNNLLTSVLGNASIAAIEAPQGSPVQECLEHITEASMRAADLCKQMLAYSGRGRFVVQNVDLGTIVEQTTQMLQISISKKAVLRFRLEKGLPPIEADATQLRQVIMNLVINASEAIGDASGVISLSTGLARVDRDYLHGTLVDSDVPAGDYVFLEVSDSGCGMSPETQARIFDPFFTTKFTGRGLGLAAVLGIVRGHKGAMKVYSEMGRGTTFKLFFPVASGTNDSAETPAAAVPHWQGEGTVLVVDDEETMRTIVARMMRLMGLEPVLTSNGREAVAIFRANPQRFAFVLLDLTMPHMDGEQTFTELRRHRPDVRVVLMSGFNAQEALVRFSGKGLAGFLQKPFTVDALRSTVRVVVG